MKLTLLGFVLLASWYLNPSGLPTMVKASEGPRLLQQLVEGARKEKVLNLRVVSQGQMGDQGVEALGNAFNQRFGLNIRMRPDTVLSESAVFTKSITELKAGIQPTNDLMQGDRINIVLLKEAGGATPIKHWEALLAEIAPEAYTVRHKISPSQIAGYGFGWATRIYSLMYNPKLISKQELPRTHKDMGNPKYKGAFTLPPWLSVPNAGILKYNKDEWLETVRAWGQNKADILATSAAVSRVVLGEHKFVVGETYYYTEAKARDPNAPIEMTFFEDFVPTTEPSYVVVRGARSPNAATLFALWGTSAEANRIFEEYSFYPNLFLGTGPLSQRLLRLLKERNLEPVGFFDSAQAFQKLQWLATTEEGKEYSRALARAQREGR